MRVAIFIFSVKLSKFLWFAYLHTLSYFPNEFVKSTYNSVKSEKSLNFETHSVELAKFLYHLKFENYFVKSILQWNSSLKMLFSRNFFQKTVQCSDMIKEWKNEKFTSPQKISSNQLFSKNVTFTKFLLKKCNNVLSSTI